MQFMRVEDSTHIWVLDQPVLLRLELRDALTREQLLRLCVSGPFRPVPIEVVIGQWNGKAFTAEVSCIGSHAAHCSQKPRSKLSKVWAPMAQ
jgi:hypothetical protein